MSIKIIKKNKLYQVDKFFSKILYDKEFGYYNKNISFDKKGDYITSPNISNQQINTINTLNMLKIFNDYNNKQEQQYNNYGNYNNIAALLQQQQFYINNN